MNIIYQDDEITVVNKPAGVDSEKLASENGLFAIHRLDMPVSGALAMANSKEAAAKYTKLVQDGKFKKSYLAIVTGTPKPSEGKFVDLLFHDRRTNKTFVVDRERKGVKVAELNYKILATAEKTEDHPEISLVEIELVTGRSHQIRVQFGSRKLPLAGDGKYGSTMKCNIALLSHEISIELQNHEELKFKIDPPKSTPWTWVSHRSKTSE